MRQNIYFIDKKKIDLNSSEYNLIYSDGRWGNYPLFLFWRKKDDVFLSVQENHWQGKTNTIEKISREEAIDFLLGEEQHPDRANDALEIIKAKVEVF